MLMLMMLIIIMAVRLDSSVDMTNRAPVMRPMSRDSARAAFNDRTQRQRRHLQSLSPHPVANKAIHYLLPGDARAGRMTQLWLSPARKAILRSAAVAHGEN